VALGRSFFNWVRTYPLAPRWRRAERRETVTSDGVRLFVASLEGPADPPFTVVLLHGLLNSSRAPRTHAFARMLQLRVPVLVPDLRGHRRSGGVSTLGSDEPHDVAAAVGLADPALPVVTVGVSLGAVAALRHAANADTVDAVVAISPYARWGDTSRPGGERLQRFLGTPESRLGLRLATGTRIGDCEPVKDIDSCMPDIAPALTVIVHDRDDHFFGPEHAEELHDRARPPKELWWVGGGHGSDLLTPELADRIVDELSRRVPAARRAPEA
jgi:pimeloyl-ACP methyl ester carboxylesterase